MTAPSAPAAGGPRIDAGAVATRLLAAIVDHYAANGWELPERKYIGGGNPQEVAADGEHLAVVLEGLTPGATDASQRVGSVQSKAVHAVLIPRATFVVRLMRCYPSVDEYGPPDAEDIQASSLDLLNDVGRVLGAIYAFRRAEKGATQNSPVTFTTVDPVGPGGGLAGYLWYLTISPVQ